MSLDGIVTRAVVRELQACVGARIHKIHQPTDHDLVLQIRGGAAPGKLLLSANPTYPRVHWTDRSFLNPLEAPMFCMLMRKHCEGGLIEEVRQVGNERIIRIDLRQRDELGDILQKTIVIELMGRHSNIILLDKRTNTIHDGIHHVTPAISSYRIVMPGTAYTAPPEQGKTDPFQALDEAAFAEALSRAAEQSGEENDAERKPPAAGSAPDKLLVAAFSGLSPLLAKEIVYRSGLAPADIPAASLLWPAFRDMMEPFAEHRYEPQIVTPKIGGGKAAFSVTGLTHIRGDFAAFATVSGCLEAFYGDKAQRDTVKQRVSDLIRFLQNERGKNEKKLEKLQETIEEAQGADKYRVLGELLTTCMHNIERGDTYIDTINYYDEEQPEIRIGLDPLLTPSENAQRYFKKYTKQRNSLAVVSEQVEQTREELNYLEALLQQLESASLSDIDEIREELVEQGYLRDRAKRGAKRGAKRRKPSRPALMCYTSSEGIPIYVGKNNTQNDFLTNKTAAPGDTWLHTKDIPGSHVVIRASEFGDATLEEAAMLAAHFSQAKSSSMVPVDYTLVRHVKKPSGAKPGFVIYDHQKTLFITPDEQRLKQLPSQLKT